MPMEIDRLQQKGKVKAKRPKGRARASKRCAGRVADRVTWRKIAGASGRSKFQQRRLYGPFQWSVNSFVDHHDNW